MSTKKPVVNDQMDALRGEALRTLFNLRRKVIGLDHDIAELALEGATTRYWLTRSDEDRSKGMRAWAMKTALTNALEPCDLYRVLSELEGLVERIATYEDVPNSVQDFIDAEYDEIPV